MKSFKMKALAVAVLGLAGMGFIGSAAAATCPSNPVPPWTSKNALGGTTIINTPGLHSTSCALYTTVNTNAQVGLTTDTVTDGSPQNEPRYRFRFYFNVDALGTFGALDGVQIANVLSATPFPASGGNRVVLGLALAQAADGGVTLTLQAACNNAATRYRCVQTVPVDLQAGDNMFEADVQTGATGTVRYWINSTSATEPAVTGTIGPIDNSQWSVKSFVMGSVSPATTQYITAHHGQNLIFDEFDSRRQTYIGP